MARSRRECRPVVESRRPRRAARLRGRGRGYSAGPRYRDCFRGARAITSCTDRYRLPPRTRDSRRGEFASLAGATWRLSMWNGLRNFPTYFGGCGLWMETSVDWAKRVGPEASRTSAKISGSNSWQFRVVSVAIAVPHGARPKMPLFQYFIEKFRITPETGLKPGGAGVRFRKPAVRFHYRRAASLPVIRNQEPSSAINDPAIRQSTVLNSPGEKW